MKHKMFKIFAVNAAGIKCKIKSFENILDAIEPTIWMLQEMKLKPNEQLKYASSHYYQIFYLNR